MELYSPKEQTFLKLHSLKKQENTTVLKKVTREKFAMKIKDRSSFSVSNYEPYFFNQQCVVFIQMVVSLAITIVL